MTRLAAALVAPLLAAVCCAAIGVSWLVLLSLSEAVSNPKDPPR